MSETAGSERSRTGSIDVVKIEIRAVGAAA